MKFEIELPDWVGENKVLRLLAGRELVAFKNPGNPIKIKITRCNQCGECCLDIHEGYLPFGTNGEGRCNMLKEIDNKLICTADHLKPDCCLHDPEEENMEMYGCSIRYKD